MRSVKNIVRLAHFNMVDTYSTYIHTYNEYCDYTVQLLYTNIPYVLQQYIDVCMNLTDHSIRK